MSPKHIIWLESFSEEKQTVKQKTDLNGKFTYDESPLQNYSGPKPTEQTIVSIRTHSKVQKKHLQWIDCIVTRSTGFDHVIKDPLLQSDTPIAYLPDYATEAVAEFNIMAALALLRRLHHSSQAVKDFNRSELTGRELSNITAGILGVGRIGRATVHKLNKLGVKNILGTDLKTENEWCKNINFEYVKKDELFENSNMVFLCLPCTKQTNGMIDFDDLVKIPAPGYLVNTGRGEVVSLQNLLAALENGPLDGMALDVWNQEHKLAHALENKRDNVESKEVNAGKSLIQDQRVIATPHNAFNTGQTLIRKVEKTLQNIKAFIRQGSVINSVRDALKNGRS